MNWSKKLLNAPIIGDVTKKVASMKANSDAQNIASHFTQFLQPVFANSSELRDEVFKIRHNVYCEELGFEPIRHDGMETDEFDKQALFAMIKHKPSDNFASCVRIVRTLNEGDLLPIEKYCAAAIENPKLDPRNFNRNEICEISRLAVRNEFRRRRTDQFKGSATGVISEHNYSEKELRCFPFIAIGLYMVAASMAIDSGIKHVYVMMEPRLARSMKFVGIKFEALGTPVEYHGTRGPYYINPDIFLSNLTPGFRALYDAIHDDLAEQLLLTANEG
ncbi:hypothetical protein tloyanaT_01200 [Thalassotalea loyana]|uniref:PEP-CTERM/exosortase system-associated acyltransferase n=1 Tax=Thalassotalea loyana TaxID=280483 RepID=A0ABQ6H6U5_9GAMM|nr:PEP-CTERM/exosortase system-associated acyltransferase [Thalassotalea loyana]GLX83868.1 hypothetical protein tloyanaT_01200 [Thalassotalea loyana]